MALNRKAIYLIIILGLVSIFMIGLFTGIFPQFSDDNRSKQADELENDTEMKFNANEVEYGPYLGQPVVMEVGGISEKLSYEDLNSQSNVVLIGTVKEIFPSKWNTPNGERPGNKIDDSDILEVMYTDITIHVNEYLKNPLSSEEVTVRVPGGTIGNETIWIEDAPSFEQNETVLLYLRGESSPFDVTGMSQGKFTVTDNGMAVRPDGIITLEELSKKIHE
jgi:hypothetical protein